MTSSLKRRQLLSAHVLLQLSSKTNGSGRMCPLPTKFALQDFKTYTPWNSHGRQWPLGRPFSILYKQGVFHFHASSRENWPPSKDRHSTLVTSPRSLRSLAPPGVNARSLPCSLCSPDAEGDPLQGHAGPRGLHGRQGCPVHNRGHRTT